MSRPTRRSKKRAWPLLSNADYAKRGRRLAERKSQEHQRAKKKREARGEVKIWTHVPNLHDTLIRRLVADICTALNKGRSPEQILSWRKAAAAKTASACRSEPVAASPARDNRAHRGRSRQDEGADDPAAWRGQGLVARRRAQCRRAAARKKAAGLKRIGLVVPEAFKETIRAILAQIVAGLHEGLLPAVDGMASGSAETMKAPPEETRAEASVMSSSCAITATGTDKGDAQGATDGKAPSRQGEAGPVSRVVSPGHPWGLPQRSTIPPRSEPRWCEAPLPLDRAEERSPLFDDIQALDWLARARRPTSGTEG